MSTYSAAWHDTPPAIRDFYRNYHRRFLCHGWKAQWVDPPGAWMPFLEPGWWYRGYSGFSLAMANWQNQPWYWGFWSNQLVYIEVDAFLQPPYYQPTGPGDWPGGYPDQFVTIPLVADNYPRPAYKPRQHYWTGKPRHRMNL